MTPARVPCYRVDMNRLGPFLKTILDRSPATSSHRKAAKAAGVSHVSIGEVLRGRRSVSVDKLLDAARAAGATQTELKRARILAAIDCGYVMIPNLRDELMKPGALERRVAKAMAALDGGR